jgi:penicillin V acylase-like amidase (Ntn superfamily)
MKPSTLFFSAAAVLAAATGPAVACSLVMWSDNGTAVVVGRNMDWADPMPVDLWSLPRGTAREGRAGRNSIRWVSRFGSVVASDRATTDGMNEKGLSAHMLWLAEADYGTRDPARAGLSVSMWAQYFLDNFATVADAVKAAQSPPFQLVAMTYEKRAMMLHLALRDKTGDSAVIEYVGGKPKVYHDRAYTVMTNSPPFDQQLAQLATYKGFGGDKPLPGTTDAADRFVRAAYYLQHLPKPASYRETVGGVLGVMRNVAQPFGTLDVQRPYVSATRWRTVADLTKGVYYFETSLSPNIVWVRLDDLDFTKGAAVRRAGLMANPDMVGDVTAKMRRVKEFVVPLTQ